MFEHGGIFVLYLLLLTNNNFTSGIAKPKPPLLFIHLEACTFSFLYVLFFDNKTCENVETFLFSSCFLLP